jgi:hypothetical protein
MKEAGRGLKEIEATLRLGLVTDGSRTERTRCGADGSTPDFARAQSGLRLLCLFSIVAFPQEFPDVVAKLVKR